MMMLLYYTKFDDVSRGKERFGRTQKDMAELLGVTERHYQKIEYGHINVSATTLILLADYFHVTTDYLLGREDTDDHH